MLIIETILCHKNIPNGIETPAVNFTAFPKSLQLALIQRGWFACVFKQVTFRFKILNCREIGTFEYIKYIINCINI